MRITYDVNKICKNDHLIFTALNYVRKKYIKWITVYTPSVATNTAPPDLPTNVTLVRKCSTGTNTLAYFAVSTATKKKKVL
jgi:hypothetical protein